MLPVVSNISTIPTIHCRTYVNFFIILGFIIFLLSAGGPLKHPKVSNTAIISTMLLRAYPITPVIGHHGFLCLLLVLLILLFLPTRGRLMLASVSDPITYMMSGTYLISRINFLSPLILLTLILLAVSYFTSTSTLPRRTYLIVLSFDFLFFPLLLLLPLLALPLLLFRGFLIHLAVSNCIYSVTRPRELT